MQLKTILNRVQRHKGFVYESCKLKGKRSLVLVYRLALVPWIRPTLIAGFRS